MKYGRLWLCAVLCCLLVLSGCGAQSESGDEDAAVQTEETAAEDTGTEDSGLALIDMTQWQYNEENDVYWQTGIVYCASPADETYENLGIYVPGAYMTGTDNGDGTYTCVVNEEGTVGGFTALTAPIVIPVETPGYSAMAAPTGYVSGTSSYTDAGFVGTSINSSI